MRSRRQVLTTAAAVVIGLSAVPALAAWNATSAGATAAAKATSLGPVTSFAGTATSSAVTLTWTPPTGVPATAYTVTRTTGTPTVVCDSVAATTCVDSGRAASTTYAYSVVAKRQLWTSAAATTNVTTAVAVVPAPAASSLALTNKTGSVAGKMEKDDTISVVFSDALRTSSMCAAWSGSDGNRSITGNNDLTITLVDGALGSNDGISISSTSCTGGGAFGTITLGSPSYVSGGNVRFTGTGNGKSTLTWTESTKTLSILLGDVAATGTAGTVTGSLAATYTPSATMVTTAGVPVTGTATSTAVQF
jgi:hypothetical protein